MAPQHTTRTLEVELEELEVAKHQTRLQQLQEKYSLLDRCEIAARRRPTYEEVTFSRCCVCGYWSCRVGPYNLTMHRTPGTKVA